MFLGACCLREQVLPMGISYFRETCAATVFRPQPLGPRMTMRGVRGATDRAAVVAYESACVKISLSG